MERLARFLDSRPALKVHYDHAGRFADYCKHIFDQTPFERNGRMTNILCRHAHARFGIEEAALKKQLTTYAVISTADHAGLMHFPILFNANLLFSGMISNSGLEYQVVLSTGRVPMDNASYPRGFYFAGKKFSFFPKSMRHLPIWLNDQTVDLSLPRKNNPVFGSDNFNSLTEQQQRFLSFLFDSINENRSLPVDGFQEQVGQWNVRLTQHFISADIRNTVPQLLYLPIEPIVRDMLLMDIAEPDSVVSRILFDSRVREIYLQEFQGQYGCWDNYSGTHFFWGIKADRTPCSLRLNYNRTRLEPVPQYGAPAPIPITSEALSEALINKRIVPSLFLEMLMLAFVEGYTLLGGFNQVTYLAWMRVAHERCMLRLGEWPTAARFARTLTDGLICGPLPFPQWESSLDMIWHHNSTNGKFNGNLDGGLTREDLDTMMNTPMKKLIQNGVDAMLDVVE